MAMKNIFVYPKYPDSLKCLYALAYNLWCSWNYEAVNLFYRIDAQKFRLANHNPVQLLLSVSPQRIEELSKDKGFLFELEKVHQNFEEYLSYRKAPGQAGVDWLGKDDIVAYFSMEFGLHECIPIYGGGLGILAGDFLKAASDLDMPLVGVGLIYKYGYFTQRINLKGLQEELFLEFDNHLVPVREVIGPDRQKMHIEMKILGETVWIKLWQIRVGQTRLILLDTDIPENPPQLRSITHELYVADRDRRLQQELVLGLGGVWALEALGIKPKIYHINEGHSAFLVIARLRQLMKGKGLGFSEAKALIRASTVFTTHTPVIAGNESFETDKVKKYLEPDVQTLGLTFDDLAAHGYVGESKDIFWLPAFAIRFSRYVNAVSKLHRDVSRRMWSVIFPERSVQEVPIDYVTNGVHSSWLSATFTELLNRHIGPGYIHHVGTEELWNKIREIPDDQIWEAHRRNKHNLVAFIRHKLMDDLVQRGYVPSKSLKLSRLFNPDLLTIVFARRFAPYKRPTLLLKDKDRLKKILTDPHRPVQLIFAGKAHPADTYGKNLIKEIIDFTRSYEVEDRVIFLENYDINIGRHLAWGADVWLNTPIREYEASGTSGMKAAINGVLNLSILDGWWPEVFNGGNGWGITAGEFYKHSELKEMAEANQIYDLLEQEITEIYYDRNESGVPEKWVAMMKESISSTTRFVHMNRVLIDYQTKFYLPSRKACEVLCQDDHAMLRKAAEQERQVVQYWDRVRMMEFGANTDTRDHLVDGEPVEIWCKVDLGDAPADLFCVELFYGFDGEDGSRVIPLALKEKQGAMARYAGQFNLTGNGTQYINVRVRPCCDLIQDLHPEMIKWAK